MTSQSQQTAAPRHEGRKCELCGEELYPHEGYLCEDCRDSGDLEDLLEDLFRVGE